MEVNMNITVALVFILFCTLLLIYNRVRRYHRYWYRKGVPFIKPAFFFGNTIDLVFYNQSLEDNQLEIYRRLSSYKYAGYYRFLTPVLVVKDAEMVKTILTKDFSYFNDRDGSAVKEDEPLTKHIFNVTGSEWKNQRTKLSPAFTSAKIKLMFEMMQKSTEELKTYLDNCIAQNEEVLMKDMMARYTMRIISWCAFGLESNTLANPDSDLYNTVKGFCTKKPYFYSKGKRLLNMLSPKLLRILGVKKVLKNTKDFFTKLASDTIKHRRENNVERNDFINLLVNIKEKEETTRIDDHIEMIAAQCLAIFIAGFDTSSNILTFCLYELAKNPDVQEKLSTIVKTAIEVANGQITYDMMKNIPYLDQVICETLRLYPVVPRLQRICTKNYKLPDSETVIEKGTDVEIPIIGLHLDSQFYPNPEKFNPENFSNENKENRHSYAFLPFGEGPRICLGKRFALMQMKLCLIMLSQEYWFQFCSRTEQKITFQPFTEIATSKNAIWLNCTKR